MWKDFDANFEVDPITGDFGVVQDAEAVEQALSNCILITKESLQFDLDFGPDHKYYLTKFASGPLISLFRTELENTINNYEPRVVVNDILFEMLPGHKLKVSIYYQIKNMQENKFEFSFIIDVKK
jgi:phage baseplate assembly protein W